LRESGTVWEIKARLLQARFELGYNRARIFYTYPMIDLFSTGGNLRNTLPHLGGTVSIPGETLQHAIWLDFGWHSHKLALSKLSGFAFSSFSLFTNRLSYGHDFTGLLTFLLGRLYCDRNSEVIAINSSKGLKSVALLLNSFSQSRNSNRQLGFS